VGNRYRIFAKFITKVRRALQVLAEGRLAGYLAKYRAKRSGHPVRKVLILSDKSVGTSEEQLSPLIRYRQLIATRLGLVFEFDHVDRAQDLSVRDLRSFAAVGLKLSYLTPTEKAESIAENLFESARLAGARALVFDGDDDLCVLWPKMIEACDAYIKKHVFADTSDYKKTYRGKSNLTEYTAQKYGLSFEEKDVPNSGPLDQKQIDKILVGWNIALDNKIHQLIRDQDSAAVGAKRPIDIGCRASVPPDTWIFAMRSDAERAITSLQERYTIHAPTRRVSQNEYYAEMVQTRLTLSPFGYGELCWRDFEAILCGSVLVKPDMSHVKTWPDLYIPYETYIPIAWDYSDLEAACAPYLADEAERQRIAANAYKTLIRALSPNAFIDRLEETMKSAGVL